MYRTHTCGELSEKYVGKTVTLAGWADSVRPHGKIGFLSLRDKYGVTQVFVGKDLVDTLTQITPESTVQVVGVVKARPEKLVNKNMSTGAVELSAKKLVILAKAEELPFSTDESVKTTEETRMKYRYLNLRNPKLQENLKIRASFFKGLREAFDKEGFLEVETPLLAKSTPEGARDYLVPSRKNKGQFYALPQSPQIFKQLLMIGGLDKYYQFAKCLRDEDLRADRQPEFTQLDMEMSFAEPDDVFKITEEALKHAFKASLGVTLKTPFPRMTHAEALKDYKTDKPNLRKGAKDFAFVWVTEFPMFEKTDEGHWQSAHHPFTSPHPDDIKLMKKSPGKVRSAAYDLVLNGVEISSGSIRIHDPEVQRLVFEALGFKDAEIREKFGFFIDAFKYGAPPHCGLALGLDRIIAMMCNTNIREVIAFPKTKDAEDLMMGSPGPASKDQLDELGIKAK